MGIALELKAGKKTRLEHRIRIAQAEFKAIAEELLQASPEGIFDLDDMHLAVELEGTADRLDIFLPVKSRT